MDDYFEFDEYGMYEDDLETWELNRLAEDLAIEGYGDLDDEEYGDESLADED